MHSAASFRGAQAQAAGRHVRNLAGGSYQAVPVREGEIVWSCPVGPFQAVPCRAFADNHSWVYFAAAVLILKLYLAAASAAAAAAVVVVVVVVEGTAFAGSTEHTADIVGTVAAEAFAAAVQTSGQAPEKSHSAKVLLGQAAPSNHH